MKKFIKNLATPNSKKSTKVLLSVKVTCASLAATTFAVARPDLAFYLLVVAGAADIVVSAIDNGDQDQSNGKRSDT